MQIMQVHGFKQHNMINLRQRHLATGCTSTVSRVSRVLQETAGSLRFAIGSINATLSIYGKDQYSVQTVLLVLQETAGFLRLRNRRPLTPVLRSAASYV